MKRVFVIIIIGFVLVSCERVRVFDLNIAEPKLVIEGVVSNLENGVFVKLSYTSSYYDTSSTGPAVSDASVVISDNVGNQEYLTETKPGHYSAVMIKGVPGRTYNLIVDVEKDRYEAVSTMKDIPVLDSVTFEKRLFYDMDNQILDTSYYPFCHFIDPIQSEDNYRMKLYKYLENELILVDFIYLFEDDLINGDTIHYGEYAQFNTKGTEVIIQLINMGQHVYNYYFVLDQALNSNLNNGNVIASSPTNPPSNISNGALGYFGALAIARKDTIAN